MPRIGQVLVLVVIASIALGQNAPSTVSPQAIFDLSEDDFRLWLSGREPKAWQSGSSDSSAESTITTTTEPPIPTTVATRPPRPMSVFRTTTSTTATPSNTEQQQFFTTTTSRPSVATTEGKSWFEEETEPTPRPDVLGEQFKPAGEDFAQWLERQMNRVQEVTFIPQTTLAGDHFSGAGLVTRLTTVRNRIPMTTFRPAVEEFSPITTPDPPTVAPTHAPTVPAGPVQNAPLDLQQWLREQLLTSQQLTDRLLAQWSPNGAAVIRADGQQYTPNAVSFQTSAVIHGHQGVSHGGTIRNPPATYQVHAVHPTHVPVRRVFHPAGSFYYTQPSVAHVAHVPQLPHFAGSYVGAYRTPLVINYN